MSKVTPTARQSAVAAGTVGLAAIGAVAGAVPAHADALTNGLPLSTNALSAAKNLFASNQGQIGGMSLRSIPVIGNLPEMLQGALPGQGLPLIGGMTGAPQQRSRLAATPPAAPTAMTAPAGASGQPAQSAQTAAPASAYAQAPRTAPPAAAPASSSPLDSLGGLGGLTGGLSGLTGGGDLLGGLTGGGGLTSSLSHLG